MVQSKEMACFRLHMKRITQVAVEIREQGWKHFRGDYSIQARGDGAGGQGGLRGGCEKGSFNKICLRGVKGKP